MADTTPQRPTPPAALLMERRRALYAQLHGINQQRQGVLMELRSIEKALPKDIQEAPHAQSDR